VSPRAGRADTTPLMQQYSEIKRRHQDAILFFRMGDFYEMFHDDAHVAARELGLTLTARNNGGAANVPLAGVPVKAATEYVRRLVERGYRVAICEQVEDPRTAKGVVRREVIETVTPGAVLSEQLLDETANNFLVAVAPGTPAGIAAIDISTGEFVLETAAAADVPAALSRYAPREIVVPAGAADALTTSGRTTRTERDPWEFDAQLGSEEICRWFRLGSTAGLDLTDADRPAVAAAAALLHYVRELQPGGLPQLARPSVRRAAATMVLDEMTRRNLELVEPVRAGDGETTLLAVVDRTRTPMGKRLLRQWLLAPLRDGAAIAQRHDAVEVLVDDARGRERVAAALEGGRDLERLAGRAAAHRASPRDLGGLRDSVRRLPDLLNALDGLASRERSAILERLVTDFDLLTDLGGLLTAQLVERPPATLGEGESLQSGVDATLDEQRDLRDGGKQFIASLQARERERTRISSLKVGYNRVFGYYLEVSKANRHLVPAHYERRQTLTGAERYVTPELKEYEARVLQAEELARARERELFDALCEAVHERLGRIQAMARTIATLDVLASFAETSAKEGYARPELADAPVLDLRQCRHPVVEQRIPAGKFIPNDILFDERQRVMLVTGPNMAGKSTILRQVGLAVVLAQSGCFVPARSARIGVVDRVFTRVGASDNVALGQSTFMVEMSETSAILHAATPRSLVLLDEIGRGTATYDGVAIAWAVTEHLHDRVGCLTMFATHYHELTQLTEELAHARNCNVAVREEAHDIIFLYRLEAGGADRSYGIHVGRLAGLPPEVVERAREILTMLEAGHHVAGREPPPRIDRDQLPLFTPEPHPVLADLQALDPERMTPLEALARLAELKRRAETS
jgi:DNA mismatch repair protein MutS